MTEQDAETPARCHDRGCARNEGHFGNHTDNRGSFWPDGWAETLAELTPVSEVTEEHPNG